MPSNIRIKKINDRIWQALSVLLQTRIQDPRLLGVYVTEVRCDRELEYANVYVSAIEGSTREKEIMEGLITARNFLRHELSGEIDLRAMPKLRFHWDPTPEKADRIEKLLSEIREESQTQLDDDQENDDDIA